MQEINILAATTSQTTITAYRGSNGAYRHTVMARSNPNRAAQTFDRSDEHIGIGNSSIDMALFGVPELLQYFAR